MVDCCVLAVFLLGACGQAEEVGVQTDEFVAKARAATQETSTLEEKIRRLEQRASPQREQLASRAGTSEASIDTKAESVPGRKSSNNGYRTIEWIDLIPEDDLDALMNPPSYVTDLEDGIFEDQISSELQNTFEPPVDDRYQQALVSTQVISEMDGQLIRIPGYVVPLEFNDEKAVTQFFLVPFFGACIHVPPPPPNQILFVESPQGLKQENLYDPYWVSGTLKTSLTENELATSAYSMTLQEYELYKGE